MPTPIPAGSRFKPCWLALLMQALCAPVCAGTLDLRMAAASEEIFRGVVQNNSATGIVRADYRFASRAYIGSRLLNNRSAGGAQFDAYAGYARGLVLLDLIPVGVDAGINVSAYCGDRHGPQQRDLDWAEAYFSVDSGPLRGTLAFAPDYFGTGAAAWRAAGQLRWPITPTFDATAVLGWNDGDGVRRHTATRGGGAAYADYSLVLTRQLTASFAIYGQLTGASQTLDDSARPRALIGLRWRWGTQLP